MHLYLYLHTCSVHACMLPYGLLISSALLICIGEMARQEYEIHGQVMGSQI